VALDPTSLQGRALVHHVSYSNGSCLPIREGSRAPRVLQLWILPPCREGSVAATTYPAVSCGPWVSNIKKSLAGLPVRQGSPIPIARVHISKAPNVRAIMGLHDVWAGNAVNASKMCGQTATVHH
jgi:hypothetical protein